ncbi:mevalonate kinase isoform X2 [Odontomachus brunneus]|uniref:mevalonate kinase isoform X2 n=1 Tax=Odontomachus brunneus TaxID=486640 RepID=UPI0013F1D18E|nr:mevalonate kinase isoform X2 [Odontomachus brunneus]XP_032671687.1 mevalonate kinase isoform X2 [Odontomachus brunneus]XP_032671688.1 mevalonate kinase isoform X2 [Odontomachus brunneus]XP_032671689.1 mevalonate kinase isoform X2 [Odontomachus brunneus]
MYMFKVSAPGKVILFGEHAVVYEKLAVAASLDQRVVLEFAELAESEKMVEISLPKVDLCLSIPLQKIKDFFFSFSFDYRSGDHDLLYEKVRQFVATTINHATFQQTLSLEVFFYSLVLVSYEEQIVLKPFRVHLDTQLSIGSGLGSSASFAVCLTACFYNWSLLQKGVFRANFDTFDLTQISQYALRCERITHGNPSGIDTSVCTFGSVVRFKKGHLMETMPKMPNMKILLVDTQVGRSTKALVQMIAELKSKYPTIINPLMFSIEGISCAAFLAISALSNLPSDHNTSARLEEYKELMLLINMNQNILAMLGVSHPSLDKICDEARKYGLAAKLTGAGGGGHAYILIPPDIVDETILNISQKLIADGFKVTQAQIGCSGVKIDK